MQHRHPNPAEHFAVDTDYEQVMEELFHAVFDRCVDLRQGGFVERSVVAVVSVAEVAAVTVAEVVAVGIVAAVVVVVAGEVEVIAVYDDLSDELAVVFAEWMDTCQLPIGHRQPPVHFVQLLLVNLCTGHTVHRCPVIYSTLSVWVLLNQPPNRQQMMPRNLSPF